MCSECIVRYQRGECVECVGNAGVNEIRFHARWCVRVCSALSVTKCAARVLRVRKLMAPFMSTKPNARNDDLPPPANGPEVSLWYHVLASAFDDLHGSDRERADSESWFQAETDGIGSFLWVCEVLGISASAIRRRLGFNLSLPRKTRFLPVLNHSRHYP